MLKWFKDRKIERERKIKETARTNFINERKNSDIPWVELIGKPYSIDNPPLEPVSERYLWNHAFILKLRTDGYKGEFDYDVMRDWEITQELNRIKILKEKDVELKKKSSEPWVEISGENYSDEGKQFELKLDWNHAFIKYLKNHGYKGKSDEEIIDKWLKDTAKQIDLNTGYSD